MDPQDKLIIPGDLRVIGRPVPGFFPFIMGRRLLPVRSDREMASRAARGPGEMAGEAGYALVGMCQLLVVRRHLPPHDPVFLYRLGETGLFRLFRMSTRPVGSRVHCIRYLDNLPFFALLDHGALVELLPAPFQPALFPGSHAIAKVGSSRRRSRSAGPKRGLLLDGPVAVDAGNFERIRELAVELSVAVVVLSEMAVHAMHPLLQVDILHMDRDPRPTVRPFFFRPRGQRLLELLV